jgi:hypothetical protein
MKSFYEYYLMRENTINIEEVATDLNFLPTTKKKKNYNYVATDTNMPPFSYTVAQESKPIVTVTADGKETTNTADVNDIIMSGPSREQYVVKSVKFPKLYQGNIGGPVHPEQSPRMVALYTGNEPVMFKASWGEDMVLKPQDYLVKEAEGKFYRIAKHEYEQTYNPPGQQG